MGLKISVFVVGQVSRHDFKYVAQVGFVAPPNQAAAHKEPSSSTPAHTALGAGPLEKLEDLILPHETRSGERDSPLKIRMARNPRWRIMTIV